MNRSYFKQKSNVPAQSSASAPAQRIEVSSRIIIHRTSKIDLLNLKVVFHKGPIGLMHMLSVVGTTQERFVMDPLAVSSVVIHVTS